MASTTPAVPTTTTPSVPRQIVGFNKPSIVAAPKRSRGKKNPTNKSTNASTNGETTPVTTTSTSATNESNGEVKESGEIPSIEIQVEEEEELIEEKKTNSVIAAQKRIKAIQKKVQRIEQYQEKTEALNADQQAAVATKPTLEAILKELNEFLVILKSDEIEEAERSKRNQKILEKRQAKSNAQAEAIGYARAEAKTVVLFQFLHLNGLYAPQQGFSAPILPSVVQQATGQEVAAVRTLNNLFANGPISGGGEDALAALNKINESSLDEAIPMVSYARVMELIAGLTSPPSNQEDSSATLTTESELPAGPSDSVTALVDGSAESTITPTFMQASELANEVVEVPEVEKPAATSTWAEEVEAQTTEPAVEQSQVQQKQQPIDWSAEQSNELPSLEGMVPASALPTPLVESDGFNQVRGNTNARRGGPGGEFNGAGRGGRGGGNYRGRGTEGGERRGGGGFRGGRGGFENNGAPREEGGNTGTWYKRDGGDGNRGGRNGENGGGRGGFYGGENRGGEYRGRGRGRGENRGRGGDRKDGATPPQAAAATNGAPAPERW